MKIKTIICFVLGGGLIVLLFFLTTYKQIAYISFDEGGYNIEVKWEIPKYKIKDKEIPQYIPLDEHFKVDEILHGDFTNNGNEDLAIYLWKRGNYGYDLPFWIQENDNSYKQHLFVYEQIDRLNYRSVWNSSNLPYINKKTILTDLDNDGLNEIVVIEQPYDSALRNIAVWQWDDWGFKNIWRSRSGNFADLKLQ
ncbi:hypothetical protein ACFL3T_00855 [Patescibacteria group bacterium]